MKRLYTRNIIVLYLFTYSIELSPWDANMFAASQEIYSILWNPKVHYRTHKCPPTSWRSILILSSRLGLPSGLFPSAFFTKTLYTHLLSPIRASCPAHVVLLTYLLVGAALLTRRYESWGISLFFNVLASGDCKYLLGFCHARQDHCLVWDFIWKDWFEKSSTVK